jgi:leucyl aminopeptidase (aminopeptidase T)
MCSLRQKEANIKLISAKYSATSTKLQDLSPVLDDGNVLAELDNVTKTTDLKVSLVKSDIRDKAGVDAATLANNWGIGIEAAKRTRLVTN